MIFFTFFSSALSLNYDVNRVYIVCGTLPAIQESKLFSWVVLLFPAKIPNFFFDTESLNFFAAKTTKLFFLCQNMLLNPCFGRDWEISFWSKTLCAFFAFKTRKKNHFSILGKDYTAFEAHYWCFECKREALKLLCRNTFESIDQRLNFLAPKESFWAVGCH